MPAHLEKLFIDVNWFWIDLNERNQKIRPLPLSSSKHSLSSRVQPRADPRLALGDFINFDTQLECILYYDCKAVPVWAARSSLATRQDGLQKLPVPPGHTSQLSSHETCLM